MSAMADKRCCLFLEITASPLLCVLMSLVVYTFVYFLPAVERKYLKVGHKEKISHSAAIKSMMPRGKQ